MPEPAALPLDELRAYLLPKTLEYAVHNSAWYEKTLGSLWESVRSLDDLQKLPELTKELATDHQDELRCGDPLVDLGTTSSGTTRVGQRYLRVERSDAELQAIAEYHQMLVGDGAEAAEPPALVLHIASPHHGVPLSEPGTLQLVWAPDDNVCGMIHNALTTSFEGRRVEALRLSVSMIKQLTVWFANRGVDPSSFGVKEIGTNAAQVTKRWRAVIEKAWGARIWDNYSVSEVSSAATECDCGRYHFGVPPVLPEVIDPFTRKRVTSGVGLLLLTTLYPYAQRQPLIRYVTGDLVEWGPPCERVNDWGLRFKGRVHQTAMRQGATGAEYLLFPTELEDVADDEPTVARHEWPFEKLGGLPAQSVGQPKVRAAFDGAALKVEAGAAFDPRLFPAQAAELAARLKARLLERHPALAASGVPFELELVRGNVERSWFVKNTL